MDTPKRIVIGHAATSPTLSDLVYGLQGIAMCCLVAGGADVFSADEPVEGDGPLAWLISAYEQGRGALYEQPMVTDEEYSWEEPIRGLRLHLAHDPAGYRLEISFGAVGEIPNTTSVVGTPLVILRRMVAVLRAVAEDLHTYLPPGFDWRLMTGCHSAASAWKMLEVTGAQRRASLRRMDEPACMVN